MTKAEIKRRASHIKQKLRTGDKVMIMAGKDKGQIGYIAVVDPKIGKAIILKENEENPDQPLPLNAVIKHRKARFQGEKSARIQLPAPIDMSNLMLLDPKTGEPTRVGRRIEDGKIVRYAKKSGTALLDGPTGGR
jgi:large subunit ribosomal protein L24